MNVLQRPLFRQAGGPVAPQAPAMAPGPMMADPAQQVQATEQAAAMNMQQVGQDYMNRTMGALDAAETPKDVIDAIRGNQMPIEARYQELASLVGEQDAMRTPETVLALVQPTIMMTEQGAMDSGIGELMQSIAGQVEMETETGEPTPMAGGVGSLMMAGSRPEEVGQPPVANFSRGGAVQRFQLGGEADSRLSQLYSEMLPTYQSILGGDDSQAKAQALFAIAQAAGQFAAGRGPQGEDLRGVSPAGQLGAALSGLSGTLGEQAAARRKTETATRLAALEAAQTEAGAERKFARDLAIARAKDGDEFKLTTLYSPTGQAVGFETSTASGREAARSALAEGFSPEKPAGAEDFEVTTLYGPDGVAKSFDTSTPTGQEAARSALAEGFTSVKPDTGGFEGQIFYKTDPDTGEVVRREINIATPAGIAAAESLIEEGFTTDSQEATLLLQDRFKVREENRAEQRAVAAENRANDSTLAAEERALARAIAAESRAEVRAIKAEARAADRTLSAEERAEARQIAQEARAEQRTLSAERRAAVQEQERYARNRADELADMYTQRGFDLEDMDLQNLQQLALWERNRKAELADMDTARANELIDQERDIQLEQIRFERGQAAQQLKEQREQGRKIINLLLPDGTMQSFKADDPAIDAAIARGANLAGAATPPEPTKPENVFGASMTGRQLAMFSDEPAVQRFETGQMPPEEETRFVSALENYLAPTINQQGMTVVNPLPDRVARALRARQQAGLPVPSSIAPELYQARPAAAPAAQPGARPGAGEALIPTENRIIPPGFDITKATGLAGGVMRGAEGLASQVSEFGLGSGTLGPGFREALEAKSKLNSLAQATDRYFTSSVTGRPLAIEYQNLQQEIVRPDAATSDAQALSSLKAMRTLLNRARGEAQNVLNNPRRYSPQTVEGARQDITRLENLLPEYDYAIGQYEGKTGQGKPDPAQFRR